MYMVNLAYELRGLPFNIGKSLFRIANLPATRVQVQDKRHWRAAKYAITDQDGHTGRYIIEEYLLNL